jgi:hypothetical protein
MAGPSVTLGSPWIPHAKLLCATALSSGSVHSGMQCRSSGVRGVHEPPWKLNLGPVMSRNICLEGGQPAVGRLQDVEWQNKVDRRDILLDP